MDNILNGNHTDTSDSK